MSFSLRLDLSGEDSTDESERDDDEYRASIEHYSALIGRALQEADLGAIEEEVEKQFEEPPTPPQKTGAAAPQWPQTTSSSSSFPPQAAPSAAVSTVSHPPPQPRLTSGPRRLYMHGFGAHVTDYDLVKSLMQFGPIARYRLFHDPVSKHSLRAASIEYQDINDAARALQKAAERELYLSDVWAPEAVLVADEQGEVARRAYEAVVHAPLPALLPPTYEMRQMALRMAAAAQQSSGGGSGNVNSNFPAGLGVGGQGGMAIGGGGMMGSSMQQQHGMQQQASWQGQGQQHAAGVGGGSAQVIVSGISSQSTPQAAKTTFEQFGRIGSFLFHRHPTTGALLPLASIEFTEHQAAANAIRAAQNHQFDRVLGPKLIVAHDATGNIARQLLRDIAAHGLGPAQQHFYDQQSQLQSQQPQQPQNPQNWWPQQVQQQPPPPQGSTQWWQQQQQAQQQQGMQGMQGMQPAIGAIGQRTLSADGSQRPAIGSSSIGSSQVPGGRGRDADRVIEDAWGNMEPQPAAAAAASSSSSSSRPAAAAPGSRVVQTPLGSASAASSQKASTAGSVAPSPQKPAPPPPAPPPAPPPPPKPTSRVVPRPPAIPMPAKVPFTNGKYFDARFDPIRQRPWQGRRVAETRKLRKLWLGDRGVVQKAFVGPATTLTSAEQFAGWREALGLKEETIIKAAAKVDLTVGEEESKIVKTEAMDLTEKPKEEAKPEAMEVS